MEHEVKLTVRIPSKVHKALKQRAQNQGTSLNQMVVETLHAGLRTENASPLSEREKIIRLLEEIGLLATPNKPEEIIKQVSQRSVRERRISKYAELRDQLKGLPPASQLIIQDREPR